LAFIEINKGSQFQIRPNFKEFEFFSKCSDSPSKHNLDEDLLNAVQYLRDKYNDKIKITSTYRTPNCNLLAGGVKNSFHLKGKALDFQFINDNKDYLKKIYNDFASRGEVYQTLRDLGINGFGFYNTFIHLDTRDQFTYWDNTNTDFGQVDLSTGEKKNIWRKLRVIFQPEAIQENKLNFLALIVLVGILVYFAVKKI
jgi:hypothetical protein